MCSAQKFEVYFEFSPEIHVLRSPESENTIFRKWSSVCERNIWKTKNRKTAKFGNLDSHIPLL